MSARGTVIKRGKSWSVVLDRGRDADGKRIRKWHAGYPTKKDAEAARTELLSKLDRGEYVPPNKLTVKAFAVDRWLPSISSAVAGGSLKGSTAARYRNDIDAYIVPKLGGVLLRDLTPDMLARFYGEMLVSGRRHVRNGGERGLSPTTVHKIHVTLHRMLRDAVRWSVVARNVADVASLDAPKPRKVGRDTMTIWTREQLRTFLDKVANDRLHAMWVLFITTGMRRGEVAGLRWSAVDLDAGRLRVERATVVVNHTTVDSTPKSERSARVLGLDPQTVTALRSHRARQAQERLSWGPAYKGADLVFTWDDGSPIHPTVVLRTFRRLTKAAGLPTIRLHDLRHSYATVALEAGESMKVVQERLGHASIAITADIYSHVSRELDQAAAERVASVIFGGA